jgi:hypothetical protein
MDATYSNCSVESSPGYGTQEPLFSAWGNEERKVQADRITTPDGRVIMWNNRLFSSERQYETTELCRLEKLAMAARLGTAYLGGDTVARSTQDDATPVQASTTEPCSQTLEDCHGHT